MGQLQICILLFCGILTFSMSMAMDIRNVDGCDPGPCNQTIVLQVVSLNDRNNEKKLWICNKENGSYLWEPIDGGDYDGEFLHPGYDCSDILDHKPDSLDGFYWVSFNTHIKRKVWCDMTTDGGGYMLVARKHDAETWSVPSKDQPVDPESSETYWTSQLGDAPMLDFMIQLSTSDSFDDIKAQWSYRLKNKRPFGQLLIRDRGCDIHSPGIGDIAYVKDLMTDEIATTTFECSIFGHSYSSRLGWAMMNDCLRKPCYGSGFFHHQGIALMDLDHTGVFSYSATGKTSGMRQSSTSYLGCYNRKCCGCFGPVGGTGDYCNFECNATLTGSTTVVDSDQVYAWVWVRSALPKRIWDKCMDFQSQDESGKVEWYKLVGHSRIPEKGKCTNGDDLSLNSGVVVVADNTTAKKVPKITGLLEFRKDENKLYLRGNKGWNLLPQEKEMNSKLTELKKNLQREIDGIKAGIPNYDRVAYVMNTFLQCTSYHWLNESNRNVHTYDSGNEKCDNFGSSKWYRFGGDAGNQMNTQCLWDQYYYCSAYYTGHLSNSHPGLYDGVTSNTVCFYYAGDCCYYSQSINVLNCGAYYVYELGSIPLCNARFCSMFAVHPH